MLVIASGADNPVRMTGHNAHDVVTADDWEDWPDFELFAGDEEDEASEPSEDAA